jgi:acetyl-CoA carboxylase / biotin carboxylase 1
MNFIPPLLRLCCFCCSCMTQQSGPQLFTVECGGGYVQAECRGLADGGYLVIIAAKSYVVYANSEAAGLRLNINGATTIFTKEYDPTCLDAEVAGKLARCLVPEGTHLVSGPRCMLVCKS